MSETEGMGLARATNRFMLVVTCASGTWCAGRFSAYNGVLSAPIKRRFTVLQNGRCGVSVGVSEHISVAGDREKWGVTQNIL